MPRGMPTPKPTFVACWSEFVAAATGGAVEDMSDDVDLLGGEVELPVWEGGVELPVWEGGVELSSWEFVRFPGCLRFVKTGSWNSFSGEEQQTPSLPQQALLSPSQRVMAT